MQLTWTQAG